ncbi:hypothetical protein GCM10009642_16820 [Nocardiopsis metallicus]|uniref:IS605 OrfB family transposase n=1 Tax=Nocardiopsis metallicus TaxID=179819 RepID=A0A840VZY7_9ACTN|nr:IS605 OrfB family transposase [Nocardiopsis metallicus]
MAYNTGLASAAAAFDAYTQSKRGERQGPGWASRAVSPSIAPCWPAGSPPGPSGWRANLREDALHQLTTSLAREYGTVAVEDLNVAGMVRNRRLAQHIADAGFGQIRRQLDYKSRWGGGCLIVADRWFASSKTCSGCGAVKAKLGLHVRGFDCDACPLVLDRDVNAARNLAQLAQSMSNTGTGVAGDRGARAPKPRGADRRTRTTRPGRKTGVGRAGGATPRKRKEAGDRPRGTQPRLW